ncbi:MAG: phosphoribosylglycinamide formyltransferase [Pseudomonadota bacterium]
MKKRVGIFISGGGSNMRALVEDMDIDHPARPVVVVSNNADAAGIAWARDAGLATLVVDHRPFGDDRVAFEEAIREGLLPFDLNIICLAGFMRVLTSGFVTPWRGRILNIHPSLLPKYRGLHTHTRVLQAGDAEHGCSVHLVTPELDDGPILGQAKVPVKNGDTPDDLAARVLVQEHRLYPAVLRRFASGVQTPLML